MSGDFVAAANNLKEPEKSLNLKQDLFRKVFYSENKTPLRKLPPISFSLISDESFL
jgi:hypothetical protein